MRVETGVDILSIERFRKAAKARGARFLNRIFTKNELSYCNKKINSMQHLAARFAGKEAISKALKLNWKKGLNWKEIEIINNRRGEPRAHLQGQVKKESELSKIGEISLSLSHCAEYAVAMAVILKGDNNGRK